MTTKHFIIAAVASFAALASVGTASATGRYYEGIDSHAPRRIVAQPTEKSASTNINSEVVKAQRG